jgi:hypothetical protein
MSYQILRKSLLTSLLVGAALSMSSCAVQTSAKRDSLNVMEVSVPMQKMALYRQGELVKTYPVSTSKFGLGDEKGSYRTPPGKMEVAKSSSPMLPAAIPSSPASSGSRGSSPRTPTLSPAASTSTAPRRSATSASLRATVVSA